MSQPTVTIAGHSYPVRQIELFGGTGNLVLLKRCYHGWAITQYGNTLCRDGEWRIEPNPSNRKNNFNDIFRFPSPEDAIQAWHSYQLKQSQ